MAGTGRAPATRIRKQRRDAAMTGVTGEAVAVGLGSSLGPRIRLIRRGSALLAEGGVEQVRLSSLYESDPVDCVPGTPPFVNAALTGLWRGSASDLLRLCQRIERECGRPADHTSDAARRLDLDILLFGQRVLQLQDLTVPHPRMLTRLFVLVPLREIAPSWVIPPGDDTVDAACTRLEQDVALRRTVRRLS